MHQYAVDENRVPTYALIAVPALALAMGADALSQYLGYEFDWVISVPSLGGFYLLIYQWVDRVGWRSRPLRHVGLFTAPQVAGTYVGELKSEWDGGVTVPMTMTIEQTWTRISIACEFRSPASSFSTSTSCAVQARAAGRSTVSYTYRNTAVPVIAERDMGDHKGASELVLNRSDGTVIGTYYNPRGNRGSMRLSRND